MPSVNGFIKTAGGRFSASFMIGPESEVMANFSGSLASSIPAFTCNTATLSYSDLKSIKFTRSFEGSVGPTNVTLNLDNGPTIDGVLDVPLSSGSTVSGSGVWTQN